MSLGCATRPNTPARRYMPGRNVRPAITIVIHQDLALSIGKRNWCQRPVNLQPIDIDRTPSPWRWLFRAVKVLICLLVAWGIWSSVVNALHEIDRHGFSFKEIRAGWLVLSGTLYLVALLPMGLYWHCVLTTMGQRPRLPHTLRAYYIGHLGKYVPGKALVVVLRTALVGGSRVDRTIAAVSVFVETLMQMSVGSAVAAAIIGLRFRHHWPLLIAAIGLMVAAGLPTLPPVFRYLAKVLRRLGAAGDVDRHAEAVDTRMFLYGWLAAGCCWFVMGLSLWSTIKAMPVAHTQMPGDLETYLLLTATVALAVVAGFLSLLPGGIGIRELVLIPLIGHEMQLGIALALVSAVTLRLIWILSEVVLSIILYFGVRKGVNE